MIQAVKGTRDILPQEAEKWQFADQDREDVLQQVGNIRILHPGAPRPKLDQGSIQVHESFPMLR